MAINFFPEEPPKEGIDLLGSSSFGFASLDDRTAEERAVKYKLALGDKAPDVDKLKTIIQTPGGQESLKALAVTKAKEDRYASAKSILSDGTPEDIDNAVAGVNAPVPDSILERQVAEAKLGTSLSLTRNPYEVNQGILVSQSMYDWIVENTTRREGFQRLYEERVAKNKKMSWGNWALEEAQGFLPFWNESAAVNDTLGEQLSKWLPGNNKLEQLQYLRSLPADEAIRIVKAIDDEVGRNNPLVAEQLLGNFAMGYSQAEADIDNMFFGLDIVTLPGVGLLRKGAFKAGETVAAKVGSRARLREAVKITDSLKLREAINDVRPAKDLRVGDARSGYAKGPKDVLEAGSLREQFAKGPVENRLKRAGAVLSQPNAKLDNILAGSGHIEEGSHVLALDIAKKALPEAPGMRKSFATLVARLPSLYNPGAWLVDASTSHITRAGDIADTLLNNKELFTNMVSSTLNVARIPADVEAQALDLLEAQFRLENKQRGLEGAILGVIEKVDSTKSGLNIPYLNVKFGTTTRELFTDATVADNFAKNRANLPEGSYDIVQEGDGYAISTRLHLDETGEEVRQALLTPENTTNLKKNLGFIPKSVSSSKDTLSKFQSTQREVLTHAINAREAYVRAMSAPIQTLSKRELRALNKVMQANRTTETWQNGTKVVGKFYDTIGDLERGYLKHIGRIPTAEEAKAYATFVQQSDMDYIFRAVNEIKTKTRAGISSIEASVNGKVLKLEGKEVDHLPFGSRYNASVYVPGTGYKRINDPGVSELLKKSLLEKKGLRVVQTYNPEDGALREALGVSGPVNFIVTKNLKKGALDFSKQLNYQPGFHVKYKDPYFIKQARIGYDSAGHKIYYGDTAFLGVSNDAKGAKELSLIEEARKAYLAKDFKAMDAVIAKGLPMSKQEINKLFKERFDPKVPFRLVSSGEPATKDLIHDIGAYEDFSNSPYNISKQLNSEYIGQKDSPLWSIREGTEDNPVSSMVDAPMLDPIKTQIQALGKIIKDSHYNDYKIAASETFAREFGDLLGIDQNDVLRNPIWALANHDVKGAMSDSRRAAARASQLAIRNLLGQRSQLSIELAHIQGKLLSAAYNRSGEKYVPLLDTLTAPLAKGDIVSKVRAAAFHMKLGLFAPHQIALQGQTVFAINAISPIHGPGATMASVAMQMHLGLLPGDVAAMKHAAKSVFRAGSGWSAKEFEESYNLLRRTGFDIVRSETSWKNDIADPKIFQGIGGKILDTGAMFFNMPERFVRITAWNTAYKEFLAKTKKAVGSLDANDTKEILNRADDLAINMTRSSHAFWQEGNWSLMTQFWGYTMRLFDLYTGMRLTRGEKFRLFANQALLYGIPVAATPMLPIWPWEDTFRQMLMENGVETNKGVMDLVMNGTVAASVSFITSLFDKEFQPDVAGRWGPSALPTLWNLTQTIQGEDGLDALLGVLGGAGGSTISTLATDTWPVAQDLAYLISGNSDGSDVLLSDLNTVGKNIASYNQAEKAWMAYNTGLYKNKKGQILAEDYGPGDALFHALTGIESQQVNDTYLQFRSAKQQQEFENKVSKEAQVYMRAYFAETDQGNYEVAQSFLRKARSLMIGGGFTEEQIVKVWEKVRAEEPLPKASQKQFQRAPNTPAEKRAREIYLEGNQ